MKKVLFYSLVVFSFAFQILAQTPQPAATPPEADGDVLKISTTLIQLDVVVTDKKGNVIRDLQPEDFQVFENGKKQNITNFSFISLNPQTKRLENTARQNDAERKSQIPIPPVKFKAEEARRTYAIVYDDLGISFENVSWVQQNLKKFVNEQMLEGDLVAIIRTGAGIGALQSFTTDKRLLIAAIDKIRWNPQGRGEIGSFAAVRPDQVYNEGADKEFHQQIDEFRNDNFSVGSLGALSYVIRGMNELPGRKSLLFVSEGFQMFSKQNNTVQPTRIYEAMRVLADLANRSSVVLYTFDPRGLAVPGALQAEDNTYGMSADQVTAQLDARNEKFFDSQQSLRYLAYETGGLAFVNQTDLNKGLQKAVEDQNSYYLLGYQPNDETFDATKNKFNRLEVTVPARPDLKVRYRSGFFGVSDDQKRQVARKTANTSQQLMAALVSPFGASEINLDLYSIFYNDERDRSFIRSLVYIDPQNLTFATGADGIYRVKFDVAAMIFDANGAAADNNITTQELKFTKEGLERVRAKGLIYDLPVPIAKSGAYQFRIALRDTATGRIGAVSQFIEVPNLKKNKLTLSNLILTNFTAEEWKKISQGQAANEKSALLDTTVRRFRRGTLLRYSYVIYNAKINQAQKSPLQIQTRLIRDREVVLEGNPTAFNPAGQTDLQRLQASGAITLGANLAPGNYILQVIAFDGASTDKKQKYATQFVEFEIVQ